MLLVASFARGFLDPLPLRSRRSCLDGDVAGLVSLCFDCGSEAVDGFGFGFVRFSFCEARTDERTALLFELVTRFASAAVTSRAVCENASTLLLRSCGAGARSRGVIVLGVTSSSTLMLLLLVLKLR